MDYTRKLQLIPRAYTPLHAYTLVYLVVKPKVGTMRMRTIVSK